jgi:hypothetical protein
MTVTFLGSRGMRGEECDVVDDHLCYAFSLRDKRGNDTVDRAVMVKFLKVNAASIIGKTSTLLTSSRSPISTGSCPSWAPTRNNPQISTTIRVAAMSIGATSKLLNRRSIEV